MWKPFLLEQATCGGGFIMRHNNYIETLERGVDTELVLPALYPCIPYLSVVMG